MARFKMNTDRFAYPDIRSHTAPDGQRVYYTDAGDATSVTTILSSLPHPELDAWKERVGEEEAERVSKEATTIGNYMHDQLEAHVKGEKYQIPKDVQPDLMKMAKQMFNYVKLFGLKKLDEVWGVEVALHYEDLYAGRTDLVGVYDGKPSIIDYKTSKFLKKDEFIYNYKLQLAAYSIAHEWMFPEVEFEQGVLLIGMRPNEKYNKPAQVQTVIIDQDELDEFRVRWCDVLTDFHSAA